jgi:anti-anti-sigma factor
MAEVRVVETSDCLTHVALDGRLDVQGVDAVELRFTAHTVARRKPTIVDLSGVSFLASLGIGMLLRAAKTLQIHKAGLVVLAPQPLVERTLRASSLDHVIPIVADRDEALRRLSRAE